MRSQVDVFFRFPQRRAASWLLLLILAAATALHAQDGNKYQDAYLKRAHETARENRYLVKADEAWTPESKLADELQQKGMDVPPPNMEPRMVHPQQIEETWNKMVAGGYCVPEKPPAICPTCQVPQNQASCKRPNILIFLVDDMGWSDFGPYGGGVAVGNASPNINKLAAGGLLLTSTYAQPTCSPTRATIHTGQLPIHHGVFSPPMYGDPGGIGGSITLPMLLKKAGYYTQGVGKWHLGENEDSQPQNVGYNDYYGFLSVSDMYTEWRDPYFNPEVRWDADRTNYMNTLAFNHHVFHGSSTGDKSSCENLREIVVPGQEDHPANPNASGAPNCANTELTKERMSIADLDQEWIRYSEHFIRGRAGNPQPWFLYHATRGCHFDNYPNDRHKNASYARTVYSDCAVEIDEMLGRLMLALEETGQDKDTFVFFTSDNGPEDEVPPHGRTPFRGGKGDTWEGGVRVPGIARWPGMIEAGRRSDGLFDLADLFTTSLAFAGVDAQDAAKMWLHDRYIYGIDQMSFLLANDGQSNRRSVLYWFLTHFAAVRMDEFKAHQAVTMPLGLDKGNVGGLSGVTVKPSYMWLFNLHQDPQEEDNIFIRHLWNQHLFNSEFSRFETVLKSYPPNIGK